MWQVAMVKFGGCVWLILIYFWIFLDYFTIFYALDLETRRKEQKWTWTWVISQVYPVLKTSASWSHWRESFFLNNFVFLLGGFLLAQFAPMCRAWIVECLGCCIFLQFKFLALLSSSLASVIVHHQLSSAMRVLPFLVCLPCLWAALHDDTTCTVHESENLVWQILTLSDKSICITQFYNYDTLLM